jgi:hypothetical protein
VDLDGRLPVVGGHHDLQVGHRFGAQRGATGPTEQIGNGNGHGTGLSSWIVGVRAGPTGRFGASNDLAAPTHRGRPGSRGSRRLSENWSAAEARSDPLRRVEAPVPRRVLGRPDWTAPLSQVPVSWLRDVLRTPDGARQGAGSPPTLLASDVRGVTSSGPSLRALLMVVPNIRPLP